MWNRRFVDSSLEEGVSSEPVSEMGFLAPEKLGHDSETFMDDERSGRGYFGLEIAGIFDLCSSAASSAISILNC
jgi:hypothetical protein